MRIANTHAFYALHLPALMPLILTLLSSNDWVASADGREDRCRWVKSSFEGYQVSGRQSQNSDPHSLAAESYAFNIYAISL